MKRIKLICLATILIFVSGSIFAQTNPLGIGRGSIGNGCFLQMDRARGFIISTSAAAASFLLSQLVLNDPQWTYATVHAGYFYGFQGNSEKTPYHIQMENIGIEREFSNWFSIILESNIQQFEGDDYFNLGIGLKVYYKWTIMRRWPVHPYIEYGAGIFYALSDAFPAGCSNLTFNLNYAIGAEYIMKNNDKLRLDVNFKHHSNNCLWEPNDGFDGNGFSFSYCHQIAHNENHKTIFNIVKNNNKSNIDSE
ncbi:MAG: acyloxyacyl hydrolase [Spirochaetales bacterium]|nr:acyloxyacyl hydrolase [Spirochaetales bacterium]